jgi:hypothetical protein
MFQKIVSDWINTYMPSKNQKHESPGDTIARKR